MKSPHSKSFLAAMILTIRAMSRHPRMSLLFVTSILGQGLFQGLLVWSFREVLFIFTEAGDVALSSLIWASLFVLAISLLQSASGFGAEVFATRLAYRVEIDSMLQLLKKLLVLPVQFFEKNSEGEIIVSLYQDLQGIRFLTLEMGRALLYISRLLGLAVIAWFISPKLTLIGLISIPLVVFPAQQLGRRISRAAGNEREALSQLHDSFLQISSGIRPIKINKGEQQLFQKVTTMGQYMYDQIVRISQSRGLARFLLEAVSGVGIILVLTLGGRDVAAGTLAWQSLLSLLIAVLAVYSPVVSLLSTYSTVRQMIPNLERTERILDMPVVLQDRPNPQPLRAAPRTIELRNVSFAYDNQLVLDSLSATFHRGETIGIVGPSGAGKSTLISLLLRFYDPTDGTIQFDGVDLRDLRLADLMDTCAIVLQEPFLFLDSIANNIRVARPDASLDDVVAAAKAANIHEEIMQMPDGYQTLLGRGEENRGISVGQKQRICIAAALLKNAPILFLDEATSNLDSVSERIVQNAIEHLVSGRTTFVIAHRMSTLRTADRILVIDQGKMVGLGPHEELLKTCETYQRLWKYQILKEPNEHLQQQFVNGYTTSDSILTRNGDDA